jgi:hypothetical protein
MGRLKKYKTEEERRDAQRKWSREYYWRNKERIDEQAKKRYRREVGKKLPSV